MEMDANHLRYALSPNIDIDTLRENFFFNQHAALFPTGRSGVYKITVADWRQGAEPMQVISGAMGKDY